MKKILLIVGALLLVGCGPSQKDKDTAAAACSEIMSTRNFESAKRVSVYNAARMNLGMKPISSSDEETLFDITLRYGGFDGCMNLFFPPPPPPPKTKAEIEAEEAAAKVAEEARLKEEEEQRIAAAEADRKAEEREKYIAENTKTTYLSCPSLGQDIKSDYVKDPNSEYGRKMWVETIIGPKQFALIQLNKVDGDNPELNGYINSEVHHEIDRSNPVKTSCYYGNAGFKESVGDKEFCAGELESGIPTESTYTEEESSSSYGHSTLEWGSYSPDFLLDRVDLNASNRDYKLGNPSPSWGADQYQCEVVSKDTYDQKFQEVQSKVKAAADAHRAELAEKESETPQI